MTVTRGPRRRFGLRTIAMGCGGLLLACILLSAIGNLLGPTRPTERIDTGDAGPSEEVVGAIPSPSPETVAAASPPAEQAPTNTPVPTTTPEPTAVPTNTPVPAESSTATPVPAMPTATPPPGAQVNGIGVPRSAIQSTFESPDIGFAFEDSVPVDGQERVMGTSRNNLATVELIGPEENLTKATIIVGVPNDDQAAITENAVYMLGFVKTAMPDWEGGVDWATKNVRTAVEEGEASTVYQGRVVTITSLKEIGMILLTIEPEA